MSVDTVPLISVIVPVYNAEKNLKRCVDSILQQTFANFELLLVDDGSKDSSGDICDSFAQIDSRVKVFHKVNEGASSARNVGIENAKGEYICFVDSDDYVDEEYLSEFFVDALKEDRYTFVLQSLIYEINGIAIKQPTFKKGLYTEKNFSELFYLNNISLNGYPFCKLYNTELIQKNNIRFNNEIHFGEDLLLMIHYLSLTKKVYLSDKSHYYYVSTTDSLSKKYNSYESEILNFHLLNNAFKGLTRNFYLDKKAKDNFYKNNLGKQLLRSMLTVYRPENKKRRKERLVILKKLYTKENIIYFSKFSHEDLKINRLGYLIYRKKLFGLFDFYYSAIYSLRYKLDKQWKYYLSMRLKRKLN